MIDAIKSTWAIFIGGIVSVSSNVNASIVGSTQRDNIIENFIIVFILLFSVISIDRAVPLPLDRPHC